MMIVGNGLLAAAFSDDFTERVDTVIFASGVSNSQECDSAAFIRERVLLEKVLQKEKKVVYFSTCSLYDPELKNSPYVKHKREMEALVRQTSRHAIFRLPQVVGKTLNARTLTNFLHIKIMRGEHFDVWRHAKRNLIDVSDVALIARSLLDDKRLERLVVNIACPVSLSIIELIKVFEMVLKKKADYSIIESGGAYDIDTEVAASIAKRIGINFDDAYIERVVRKYYDQ
jgi:nucleoside-diphosphate-sugar epimerase